MMLHAAAASPRAAIAAAMASFAPLPARERHARVSHWTMYYLGALIVPFIAEGIGSGRVPPSAIDALTCTRDANGHVICFQVRQDALVRDVGEPFDDLVTGHIAILIAECARAGFPARVGWSNAAVMIDHGLDQARTIATRDETMWRAATSLLLGARYPGLGNAFRHGAPRHRRVCCLRHHLPGGATCPGICPRARRIGGPEQATFTRLRS